MMVSGALAVRIADRFLSEVSKLYMVAGTTKGIRTWDKAITH